MFFRGIPSLSSMNLEFQSILKAQLEASKGIVLIPFSSKVLSQDPSDPVIFQLPPPKENTV